MKFCPQCGFRLPVGATNSILIVETAFGLEPETPSLFQHKVENILKFIPGFGRRIK